MTNEEKVEAYKMRLEGATLQEIGDRFGLTRERIRQVIPWSSENDCRNNVRSSKNAKYKNIDNWRVDHKLSLNDFSLLVGYSSLQTLRLIRGEGNPTKRIIDRFLEVTGMTYEEAFKTEE